MEGRFDQIEIDQENIGNALKNRKLWVPPNQRDYSWKDKHVSSLYDDFEQAIDKNAHEYFLGSIVVIKSSDNKRFVVDGQQRLATSLILLAAIRDFHDQERNESIARNFERDFILTSHYLTPQDATPHLYLNERDREYFLKRVLLRRSDPRRTETEAIQTAKLAASSHKLIDKAAKLAAKRIRSIVQHGRSHSAEKLDRWVEFMLNNARVIWVEVPDESSAYLIFETMNDRGLELSASDLIKNYLFGHAGAEKIESVKHSWSLMVGSLDTVAGIEVKDYVRHYWISRNGTVRSQELFEALRNEVKNPLQAVEFSEELASSAIDYVSLLNPAHSTWNLYGDSARKAISTLNLLAVQQVRPMLLIAKQKFTPKEMSKLLTLAVSWSVRLLLAGIQGSGNVETVYGNVCKGIASEDLKNANDVASQVAGVVPKDNQFELIVAEANVSKANLARYYLRAMEQQEQGDDEPYFIPNDEALKINVEHIMPETRSEEWQHIPEKIHEEYASRLGNQVLLQASVNSVIGSRGFDIKQPELARAKYKLTQQAAEHQRWEKEDIEEHQKFLAAIAVKTWPLKLSKPVNRAKSKLQYARKKK